MPARRLALIAVAALLLGTTDARAAETLRLPVVWPAQLPCEHPTRAVFTAYPHISTAVTWSGEGISRSYALTEGSSKELLDPSFPLAALTTIEFHGDKPGHLEIELFCAETRSGNEPRIMLSCGESRCEATVVYAVARGEIQFGSGIVGRVIYKWMHLGTEMSWTRLAKGQAAAQAPRLLRDLLADIDDLLHVACHGDRCSEQMTVLMGKTAAMAGEHWTAMPADSARAGLSGVKTTNAAFRNGTATIDLSCYDQGSRQERQFASCRVLVSQRGMRLVQFAESNDVIGSTYELEPEAGGAINLRLAGSDGTFLRLARGALRNQK